MSDELMSCEALEKLIQQEIGELDQIHQKLNLKHQHSKKKEDLLEQLDNSLLDKPRTPNTPSHLGFGRPKATKSTRRVSQSSVTPLENRIQQKSAVKTSHTNLNKKNVRAMVYQDQPVTQNSKIEQRTRPSRVLSISSDDESSVDSNMPKKKKGANRDDSSSVSPNLSSKTLKKKNLQAGLKEINKIQQRKTKLSVNHDAQKNSVLHEKSTHEINIRMGQNDSKSPQPTKEAPVAHIKETKSKLLNQDMPTTNPIQANKGYMGKTKASDIRQADSKQINTVKDKENKKSKNQQLTYKQPTLQQPQKNQIASAKVLVPVTNKSQFNQKESRSKTPTNKTKTPEVQKLSKNQIPANSQKEATKAPQPQKVKKLKKESAIDDKLFNNDDLFAKLNQLTKLNRKIEKQNLIEDGLIDETDIDKKINQLERSLLSVYDGSENSDDLLVPDTKVIESNLRKKILSKQAKKPLPKSPQNQSKSPITKKETKPDEIQSSKSFIEQQLQEFKEQRNRKIKPSEIDFDRLLNPQHKKLPSELKSECTFQPMLSKKSLSMANKLGDANERLYSKKSIKYSKTPEKINTEPTFTPKISTKSIYIDQKKGGHQVTRHERLLQMGEKYSAKRKIKKADQEEEESMQLQSHSFKPSTSAFKGTQFDVCLAERASRWADKKDEKLKRKKQEIDEREHMSCSFQPLINKGKTVVQNNIPDSLYSSRFLQDGIKSYFTRLEQARKIKREASDRLENWGRSKSNIKTLGANNQTNYQSTSSFHTPVKGADVNQGRSQRRSQLRNNSQFEAGNQVVENQPFNDKSINDTINLLRKNLQGINIHLGN